MQNCIFESTTRDFTLSVTVNRTEEQTGVGTKGTARFFLPQEGAKLQAHKDTGALYFLREISAP